MIPWIKNAGQSNFRNSLKFRLTAKYVLGIIIIKQNPIFKKKWVAVLDEFSRSHESFFFFFSSISLFKKKIREK